MQAQDEKKEKDTHEKVFCMKKPVFKKAEEANKSNFEEIMKLREWQNAGSDEEPDEI